MLHRLGMLEVLKYATVGKWLSYASNDSSDEADKEITAAPRMIHRVSSFVVSNRTKLTPPIATVTQSVSAT